MIWYLCMILMVTTQVTWAQDYFNDSYRDELHKLSKKNHRPMESYRNARKSILQQLHLKKDNRGYFVKDVYCEKNFRKNVGPHTMPNHSELNIEHTWPQSRFSSRFPRNVQKVDLHHLFPSDSRSNSSRGNFHFSQFGSGGRSVFDGCETSKMGKINETGADGFEPPREHKGNVARALFYFAIRYHIRIPEYEEFFLRQWHLIDPVDSSEELRNDEIEAIQGNRNPFIDEPELIDLINDF